MSVKIMSAVWEDQTLQPTAKLVLLSIADHADDDGMCFPSMARLCRRTGLGERTIQGIIGRLVQSGWLEVERGGGRKNCNVYRVKTPQITAKTPQELRPSCDETPQHMPPLIPETPQITTETPQITAQNPAAAAPEPSRTVKEPSVRNDAREILAVLSAIASPEAARSFIDYRKRLRRPLSITAANRLASQLVEIKDAGGDPDDALGLAEERGWQAIKADWYTKAQAGAGKPAKPSNSTSAADTPIDVWRGATRIFVNQGNWRLADRSPPPDDPNTLVPAHILREFNISQAA